MQQNLTNKKKQVTIKKIGRGESEKELTKEDLQTIKRHAKGLLSIVEQKLND